MYEAKPILPLIRAAKRRRSFRKSSIGKRHTCPYLLPDVIVGHRGIVLNEPIGALAHLQLGRADALQRDTPKARAAYQDFLTLWKDADPDIPILKQAKAEYAKLQ